MSTENSILTVGSLAFDSVTTPAGKADGVLGGSVNYFSIAASFHCPLSVVAVVGEDFPKNHLEWLSSRKIDVSGVQVARGKTFHWVGQYDQNMNEAKTLSTALNVFEHFKPQLSSAQKNMRTIFLGNIDPVLQTSVLEQNTGHHFVGCDSMNFWIAGKPEDLKKTLKKIDLLSINEGEAYLLSQQKNLRRAAEIILGMGPSVVIIKRGEYGASLFSHTDSFLIPAFPVSEVVDPTGAGDSFAGGMMGTLAKNGVTREWAKAHPEKWNAVLRRAVVNGSVMASFTVEDFSINRLMRLEASELEARTQQFLKMISVS